MSDEFPEAAGDWFERQHIQVTEARERMEAYRALRKAEPKQEPSEKDRLLAGLRHVHVDLNQAKTRLDEAINAISAIPFPPDEDLRCPECGAMQRGLLTLSEHRYNVHAGPVPEHYLAAERLSGLTD